MQRAAPNKRVLTINIDETAICLHTPGKGYKAPRNTAEADTNEIADMGPLLETKRRYITHVGLICDDDRYQPWLPQVLKIGRRVLSGSAARRLQAVSPPNVYIASAATHWTQQDDFIELLAMIAYIFHPERDSLDIVVLVDATGTHLTRKIFAAARFYGIQLCPVAALMTWLLQPLDTHVFAEEKKNLHTEYTNRCLTSDTSVGTFEHILQGVSNVVGRMFSKGKWAYAFERDGYTTARGTQECRLSVPLQGFSAPYVPRSMPTAETIASVLPKKMAIHPDLFYNTLRRGMTREDISCNTNFSEFWHNQAADILQAPLSSHTWVPKTRITKKMAAPDRSVAAHGPSAVPGPDSIVLASVSASVARAN